jgi:hypothetical protein
MKKGGGLFICSALALMAFAALPLSAAELTHRWSFNGHEHCIENRAVDYANLHYANLRKLHIALFAGFCYNIVT